MSADVTLGYFPQMMFSVLVNTFFVLVDMEIFLYKYQVALISGMKRWLLTFLTVYILSFDCMGFALQLRLNKDGHIIGTEYLSDLVEKEHTVHKHGESSLIICLPSTQLKKV